jgi:hypothetical protein
MTKKLVSKVRIGDLSARAGEPRQQLSEQELSMVGGGKKIGTYHYFRTNAMCGGAGGDDDENGYCTMDDQ